MAEEKHIQVLVIGAGPGGYAAAFSAADQGLEVMLVDKRANPGGVCLFCGCIPSKALLHATGVVLVARHVHEIGITFGSPEIEIEKLRQWKEDVVKRLTGGLGQLAKTRKVQFIQGEAKLVNANKVHVKKNDGGEFDIACDNIVLAPGSQAVQLPFAPFSQRIMDSTAALDLPDIPKRLLVVGGGYIGLELGSVYAALGSEVSVVEMTDSILPGVDRDLSSVLFKKISKNFKAMHLLTKVSEVKEGDKGVQVTFETKDGKTSQEEFDKLLVAVGRKPRDLKSLGIENTNIKVDAKGFIPVDDQRRTTEKNIFAIGDIAGQPMLAHKATAEGRLVGEVLAGKKFIFEPQAIPAVVFTDPEIAWCGLTEQEAKESNTPVQIGKFPWAASGRAVTLNRTEGFTKLILDPKTKRVLGMALVGEGCGELISEGVLAIEMGAVAEDIALSIHPHPTRSETLMEAAENAMGQSTHFFRKKGGSE